MVRYQISCETRKKRIIMKARNVLKANAAKIENRKKGESLDGHQPDPQVLFRVFVLSCFRDWFCIVS